ncbi:MAG: hypothetical protein AAF587_44815, partial [Bacteroidota bacterium]
MNIDKAMEERKQTLKDRKRKKQQANNRNVRGRAAPLQLDNSDSDEIASQHSDDFSYVSDEFEYLEDARDDNVSVDHSITNTKEYDELAFDWQKDTTSHVDHHEMIGSSLSSSNYKYKHSDDDRDKLMFESIGSMSDCLSSDDKKPTCTASEFALMAEIILLFHAWYKIGCDLHVDRVQRYHHSIRYMLLILKSYIPRASGFNWNIQKFHEVLHTCFNILNLGHPMNYDASSGERNMKPFGIQPGLRAGNVGGDDFMVNSSNRVHENQLIHQANEELNRYNESKIIKADNEEAEPKTTLIGYPDYLLRQRGRGVIEGWRHQGKGQHKRLNPIERRELGKFKDIETFRFYTECKVKGNLLRAHPCYNGAEWYDWALVTSDDYEQIYPVKIVAFYSKVNAPGQ